MKHLNTLMLAMFMSMVGAKAFAYEARIGGIYYNFLGDEATVTNNGNNSYSNIVVIPESVTYNGKTYTVTSISYQAFEGCSNLTSVTIPNSVTSIFREAFANCSSLTSITIPNSVTEIYDEAFCGCSGLTSIKVGTGNTKYDSRNNCNAIIETATNTLISGCKNTIIPNSVTEIGYEAFCGCSGLTSITIPNSVFSIGSYAFFRCSGLTSVTIPNSVTGIDFGAFQYCSSLTSVTIPNSVTSIGHYAFYYCSKLTSVTIPNSVTSIGGSAFEGCSGLKSITIPEGVTSIGFQAFRYCSSLTSVTIPNSVTSIGASAFSETRWFNAQPDGILYLDNWFIGYKGTKPTGNLTIKSGTRGIAGYAFSGCSGLTSVTIPNGVTSIGNSAFSGCSGLTSITIPNSVTSIGGSAFSGTGWYDAQSDGIIYLDNWLIGYKGTKPTGDFTIKSGTRRIAGDAFEGCSGLTSVTIPNSVTSIGSDAFEGCSSLTSITIPNSVTSIDEGTFWNCYDLTSATIPNSVTSIGYGAFARCRLTDVWCYAESVPSTVSNPFDESSISSATLHVPAGSIEKYKAKWPWSKFGNIVTIEDDEVTATDVSAMSYAVYAQPAIARKGSQATLTVCMKNTQPITLWQADLTLPAGFTLATDSYGDPMVSISGSRTSTSRHSISTSTLSDGRIRILCSSSSNKTFTGTDGEVATITLNVASNVNDGDYAVKFNNIKLVEANETKHEVDEVVSVITVKNYTLGDVNNDGSIDGADLVGIVNYILDRPAAGNIREAADVNQDGIIDGSDYVREVNAILGKVVLSARRKANEAEATESDYIIYSNDFDGVAGKQATLCLNMKNTLPVTLWQADLVLPEGVSIATDEFGDPMVSITGGRTTEARHTIATNTLPDGSIRILCSSNSNKTFTGIDGEVATITLNIDKDIKLGNYPVALKNILIVEADETRHACDYNECTLNITNSTSIKALDDEQCTMHDVYNLAGQQMVNGKSSNSKMPKGINIIRYSDGTTRKVIVKQ